MWACMCPTTRCPRMRIVCSIAGHRMLSPQRSECLAQLTHLSPHGTCSQSQPWQQSAYFLPCVAMSPSERAATTLSDILNCHRDVIGVVMGPYVHTGLAHEPFMSFLPCPAQEVEWRLMPGQRVGLVGANGAGKSTLLKCLCGTRKVRRCADLAATLTPRSTTHPCLPLLLLRPGQGVASVAAQPRRSGQHRSPGMQHVRVLQVLAH